MKADDQCKMAQYHVYSMFRVCTNDKCQNLLVIPSWNCSPLNQKLTGKNFFRINV